jgi:hypothetical protein
MSKRAFRTSGRPYRGGYYYKQLQKVAMWSRVTGHRQFTWSEVPAELKQDKRILLVGTHRGWLIKVGKTTKPVAIWEVAPSVEVDE